MEGGGNQHEVRIPSLFPTIPRPCGPDVWTTISSIHIKNVGGLRFNMDGECGGPKVESAESYGPYAMKGTHYVLSHPCCKSYGTAERCGLTRAHIKGTAARKHNT